MQIQLRTYSLQPGTLAAWIRVWREEIKPIREDLGFTVPAAWTVPETDTFIWLLAYDGPDDWAALDAAFHASPRRRAITPDPAGMITAMHTCFLTPVD